MRKEQGVPPQAGSGCQPTASAADASSRSDIPNAEAIMRRATEMAKERFPVGTASASALAAIVREAVRELTPHVRRADHPVRHNKLDLLPDDQRAEAIRICTETTVLNAPFAAPCVDSGFVCHHCQDLAAIAIEARSDATGTGAAEGKSAGRQASPTSSSSHPNSKE